MKILSALSLGVTMLVVMVPTVFAASVSTVATLGQQLTLTSDLSGASGYYWTRNGRAIAGAAGSTLNIASIAAGDGGCYIMTALNGSIARKMVFYVRVARANDIVAWGDNTYGQTTVPAGLKDLVDVSAGVGHTLALRADGTVVAWGRNNYGQCDVPAGLSGVVQVSAGATHSVALKADGTVVAWGDNSSGQTTVPAGLSTTVQVSAGGVHTVALKNDGTVLAWGGNLDGQLNVPPNLGFAFYVSAGLAHNLAINETSVIGWGRNNFSQSASISGFASLAVQAGANHSIYVDWSGEMGGYGNVGALPGVWDASAISVRERHGLALKNDGSIVAWGPNSGGENVVPTGVGNVQAVAAGSAFSVVSMSRQPPSVLAQPRDKTAAVGAGVSFAVSASAAVTYQWLYNGVALTDGPRVSGATSSTLNIAGAQLADTGSYSVRMSNAFGDVTSQVAHLVVQELLVINKAGVTANNDGSSVTLGASVSGSGSITYQWYSGVSGDTSSPVAGATSSSLTIARSSTPASYWLRVSNGSASADGEAIPVGKWTLIDPLFDSAQLLATAYGAGKYVVIGNAAGYSTNALDWKMGTIAAGADLRVALFDGARFVAGGVRGQIFTSLDGIAWQNSRPADAGQDAVNILTSAAYGNGITVFAGTRGQIMSSVDGTNWAWRAIGTNGEVIDLLSVAFGSGRFVAVGKNAASEQPRIYQSADGVSWTACTFSLSSTNNSYTFGKLSQVVYTGGRFVALGSSRYGSAPAYVLTSSDGISWNTPVFTNVEVNLDFMAFGDGQFFSADGRTSADGFNWSARSTSLPSVYPQTLVGLGYGNGVFLWLSGLYDARHSSIYTSSDLVTWTARVGVGLPNYLGYGEGKFVAVSQTRTAYSFDGVHWTFKPTAGNFDFGPVSFGNGLFVSVSTYTGYGITHLTSTDGINWTPQHAPIALSSADYLGGQWVARGYGAIFTSPDAITWTQRYSVAQGPIASVAYGGGRYVGVGTKGVIVVSDDGIIWTPQIRPTNNGLIRIAYGAGRFVAIDAELGIWSSPDGVLWTSQSLPAKVAGNFSGFISTLLFGGGRFLANYGDDVLSSADGLNWQVDPGALKSNVLATPFAGAFLSARNIFWAADTVYSKQAVWLRSPEGSGAPEITSTPDSVIIASGATATLSVSAAGTGLFYQWYEGISGDTSHPVGGANSPSFVTGPLTQNRNYWVRISNSLGIADSATVAVRISVSPVISVQPADVEFLAGSFTTLSVIASGTPLPTYQWHRGLSGDTTQPVSGATSASLSVSDATAAHYWVRVSNIAGAVDSVAALTTPWFERTEIKGQLLSGVAYGAGRWVVTGFGSRGFYSDSGASWLAMPNGYGGNSEAELTYGNGVFLGTGSNEASGLWRSADGVTWKQTFVAGSSTSFRSVSYAGGLLFALGGAAGEFATSMDGVNWTRRNVGDSVLLSDVAYGNGIFVLAAGSKTYVSADLVTWTAAIVTDTETRISDLAYGAGRFVGVGGANQGKIMSSIDGTNWTEEYVYSSNGVYDVAFDEGRFVVSAIDNIIVSHNGTLWHAGPFSNTAQIAVGGGSAVAIGRSAAWQSALSIAMGPVITTQPLTQGIVPGQSATVSVAASGASLTYQWKRNDVSIGGANMASFTIPNFQAGNAGSYSVVVTGDGRSLISASAYLAIVIAPQLLTQPESKTVKQGDPVFFEVTLNSEAPAQYAWSKNGVPISGATEARLYIPSAQASHAGSYSVTVTNAAGSVVSGAANLTVNLPPVITQAPSDMYAAVGVPVSFTVQATSGTALVFTWQRSSGNGVWSVVPFNASFSGQLTNTLTITNPTQADSGYQFSCIVSNSAGFVISSLATLTVAGGAAPAINFQPAGQSIAAGANATFTVVASGVPTPSYKWQRLPFGSSTWADVSNGGGYSGATTASLTVMAATADAGGDQFRCVITNAFGSVTSMAATLNVTGPAMIKLAAGRYHSLRLGVDSRLRVTGNNSSGQLGDGTTTSRTAVQKLAFGSPLGVADLAAGAEHSLIITRYRALWAVGLNGHGQLGDGTKVNRSTPVLVASDGIVAAGAGIMHTAYLKADGTLWTVGGNDVGQLGNGTFEDTSIPVQIATGVVDLAVGARQTLFLKSDGTLWGAGDLYGTPTLNPSPVQLASGVKTMAAGGYHSLFVKIDGTLWSLGYNPNGQLGDGTTTNQTTPVQIATDVKVVSAGYFHSFFIKNDGALWGMGYNNAGQLGDASNINRALPIQITTHVTAVSASLDYTLFAKDDGSLWGMGSNASGQFGNGTFNSSSIPVLLAPGTLVIPDAPVVVADKGSQAIQLFWVGDGAASSYEIWRSTTNDLGRATRIVQGLRWPMYSDRAISAGMTYYYWVKSVNAAGSSAPSYSAWATYIAGVAPYFIMQPTSQSGAVGDGVTFEVRMGGSNALTYRWQRKAVGSATWLNVTGGPNYLGAGSWLFGVTGLTLGMNGDQFRVMVTNYEGSVISNEVTLGVSATGVPPGITQQPVDQNVAAGATASFGMWVSGSPFPSLQWQRLPFGSSTWVNVVDAVPYSGATTAGLYVFSPSVAQSGDQFRCIATNMAGSATTNAATLTVTGSTPTLAKPWADLSGDGIADLLWRNSVTNEHAAWLMNGTGASGTASYGLPAEWRVIKAADFDGDGKSDLLWRSNTTGAVVLWRMINTMIISSTWIYDSGTDWSAEIFADFNGDGQTDILWHNTVNGQYAFWLMNGGTVASASGFSIAPGWSVAKAADFNGDGKSDLLWRNASTGGVVMWLQNGTTTMSSTWIYDSGTDWAFQLFADFNGDGKTDILWRNTVTGQYAFWLMDGATVASASGFSIAAGWEVTHAADFNGDGKSDLIWRDSTSGGMVMWMQNGTITMSTAWIYDSGTDWEIKAAKDFNGDSKADILWRNTVTGAYGIWLMDGASAYSASGFSLPAGWGLIDD